MGVRISSVGKVYTAGEGIDIDAEVISGEDASSANKGIASFNATDFTVTTGNVVLSTERIYDLVGSMVTGNTETGITVTYQGADNTLDFVNTGVLSCVAGEGIDVSGATGNVTISGENSSATNKGIVIVGAGEGIDVSYASGTATVSGENATSANKGIASFDDAFFTVTSGDVAFAGRTSYYSIAPSDFIPIYPSSTDCTIEIGYLHNTDGSTIEFVCPIHLHQAAYITSVVMYGNNSSDTWRLERTPINSDDSYLMANGNVNSSDSSISDPTIDNSAYAYVLYVSIANNSYIYGGSITFSTYWV